MVKRILIVEDDEGIALGVTDLLLDMEYEVSRAGNGIEGMKVLSKISVEGVLLDLNMPVMDGLTFLEHLRRGPRYATLPVIVMSAVIDNATLAIGRDRGVSHYLRKPFDRACLEEKCLKVFGEPKSRFLQCGKHQSASALKEANESYA